MAVALERIATDVQLRFYIALQLWPKYCIENQRLFLLIRFQSSQGINTFPIVIPRLGCER